MGHRGAVCLKHENDWRGEARIEDPGHNVTDSASITSSTSALQSHVGAKHGETGQALVNSR
jgi:hypothetical protein